MQPITDNKSLKKQSKSGIKKPVKSGFTFRKLLNNLRSRLSSLLINSGNKIRPNKRRRRAKENTLAGQCSLLQELQGQDKETHLDPINNTQSLAKR